MALIMTIFSIYIMSHRVLFHNVTITSHQYTILTIEISSITISKTHTRGCDTTPKTNRLLLFTILPDEQKFIFDELKKNGQND
jgi:hypothetical protein